jgi:integrase
MTNKEKTSLKKEKIEVINLDEYKEKGDAWNKARLLEADGRISNITRDDILKISNSIEDYKDRALFILAYFTAGRISELVRYQKIIWGKKQVLLIKEGSKPKKVWIQDWKNKKKIGEAKYGIVKKDITEEDIKGIKCLVVRLRNLKNKRRSEQVKILPIKLDNDIYRELNRMLMIYVKSMEFTYQELFPFGVRNAERIINKTKLNPHSLRKIRLTHLVRYDNFGEQKLRLYAGWSDSRPAVDYVKLTYEDLV